MIGFGRSELCPYEASGKFYYLRTLCFERPADWDKYFSASLFAYGDAPQESLGFSPFELVYGHEVRGPMKILRELWTKEVEDPEARTTCRWIKHL